MRKVKFASALSIVVLSILNYSCVSAAPIDTKKVVGEIRQTASASVSKVEFRFSIENDSDETLCIPTLYFDGFHPEQILQYGFIFLHRLSDSSNEVRYLGISSKPTAPLQDFVILPPGKRRVSDWISLTKNFDINTSGRYRATLTMGSVECSILNSGYIHFGIDGNSNDPSIREIDDTKFIIHEVEAFFEIRP